MNGAQALSSTGRTAARAERMQQWEHWLGLHTEEPLLPELPLVDAHHHLWDRGGHTYLLPQFRQDAQRHKVEASVYVECLSGYRDSGPEHLRCVGETEILMGVLSQPFADHAVDVAIGIVGRADLALGAVVDMVLNAHVEAAGTRFKGIRYVTAWDADPSIHGAYPTHARMLAEPAVQAGAQRLGARGMTLDLWCYFHQLGDVSALARACPGVTIVLDHFGGPIGTGPYAGHRAEVFQRWRQGVQALRVFPNVCIKLGGLAMVVAGFGWRERAVPPSSIDLAQAWQPYVDGCLESFGADRCMFESNFPVDRTGCSYGVLWNAFKRLAQALSQTERDAVCAGTARRVYRLPRWENAG
ncbi:MAG: amidohydrolase family protein [Rhodoferax sp.]|nr:amidohydrolase family protein [Rhodoferax sp.]